MVENPLGLWGCVIDIPNEFEVKLASFVNLRRGWDSYDAPVPSIKSINKAREFIHFVHTAYGSTLKPSRVVPSVVGGIGITWKRGDRRAYMEFLNTNKIGLLFDYEGNEDDIMVDVFRYEFEFEPVAQQIKNFLKNTSESERSEL